MITEQEVINRFFEYTVNAGYVKKARSGLVSPYFAGEFNLSAGHQYVIPVLRSAQRENVLKLCIDELCIRRIDFEKLGESPCHLLLFEMGVMGIFGYLEEIKPALNTVMRDMLNLLQLFGFELKDLYFSVSDGATILHTTYPADSLSFSALTSSGIPAANIFHTKGRQNFIFSKGVGRPAGNSIEVFCRRESQYTEIASINVYKYLFSEGKLLPTINNAIGGGFGFGRITYLLNGYNSVFELDPFASFVSQMRPYFRGDIEVAINQNKLFRILELIRTLTFIENDGQKMDQSPHGKIMKGFYDKLQSEIAFLGLEEDVVQKKAYECLSNSYSSRYKLNGYEKSC